MKIVFSGNEIYLLRGDHLIIDFENYTYSFVGCCSLRQDLCGPLPACFGNSECRPGQAQTRSAVIKGVFPTTTKNDN